MSVETEVEALLEKAQRACAPLAQLSDGERNAALVAMAQAIRDHSSEILSANAQDMEAAKAAGVKESLLDRLMLNESRLKDIACALEDLSKLSDPLGKVLEERTLESGILLQRVSVPLGVVAVVYEARPNVTADAAGICLKSGNACVLRGGSLAANSCIAIARVLAAAAVKVGLPEGCISIIESTDRAATDILMRAHGKVDVLVPRGGAGLIRHCVDTATVPVIETGTGNCHVYVHKTADLDLARSIVLNAKCRRYGVCNAAETLLVDEDVAKDFLPDAFRELAAKRVVLHCDELGAEIAQEIASQGIALQYEPASEYDWETEYLAPELAVKCVSGVQEAVNHINTYGTKHSEAIVANAASEDGKAAIERFLCGVDAAAVYVNASTAWTDGGMFGLGAEIGISTQKLHVRGPFATEGLTTYKYVLRGNGQVRE